MRRGRERALRGWVDGASSRELGTEAMRACSGSGVGGTGKPRVLVCGAQALQQLAVLRFRFHPDVGGQRKQHS